MIVQRLAAFFLLVGTLQAGAVQELEKGLTYARISDLDKDGAQLESALAQPDLILDLRNAIGSAEATKWLTTRLAQVPAKISDHRFILLNPTTAAGIVEAAQLPLPRQLTIGPRTPALQTDIAVPTSLDADRRAFDAFASGEALKKLDDSNPEKKRYDESTLAKNRAAAAADADAAEDPEAADLAPPTPAEKKTTTPPVQDLVLERAIQLHHALLAAPIQLSPK